MFYGEPDPVYLPMMVEHESDVPKETSQILPGKLIPSVTYVDGVRGPNGVAGCDPL